MTLPHGLVITAVSSPGCPRRLCAITPSYTGTICKGTRNVQIVQCSAVFPDLPTDRSGVAYIITLLAGRAREWGAALWNADSPTCFDFQTFTDALIKVFELK